MQLSPYFESRVDVHFNDIEHSTLPTSTTYSQDFSPYGNSPFTCTTPSRGHTPASSAPSPALQDKSPGQYDPLQQQSVNHQFYSFVPPATTQSQSLIPISASAVMEGNLETQMADCISASPTGPYFAPFCVSEITPFVERTPYFRDRYAFHSAAIEGMETGSEEMFSTATTTNQSQYRTPKSPMNDIHNPPYSPMTGNNSIQPPQHSLTPNKKRSTAARAARTRPLASRRRSMAVRAKDASPLMYKTPHRTSETTDISLETKAVLRPTLQLREDAKEEELYLMELRREISDDKGKGMWEEITRRYADRYGHIERSALQMKLTRAINSHCIWPQSELDLLIEAWRVDNEQRYQRIIQYMTEKGGCKVWPWRAKHIEAQLVKLGLEEPEIYNQERSRRKASSARKKNTLQATMAIINRDAGGNGDLTTWIKVVPSQNPMDFNSSPQQQQQQQQQQQRSSAFMGQRKLTPYPLDTSTSQQVLGHHFFSDEARERMHNQIEQKYYPDDTPTATQTTEFLNNAKGKDCSLADNRQGFQPSISMKGGQPHGTHMALKKEF